MEKSTQQFINKKIEGLASMVAKGFEHTTKDISEVKTRLDGIDKRLDGIDTRLDRIENLLIRAHENRIERLEDKVRVLETALGRQKLTAPFCLQFLVFF